MNKESSPAFWEEKYRVGTTPWDTGQPVPVFQRIAREYPPGKLCLIGCGRGHDALTFAQAGFSVTGVDFSASALQELEQAAQGKRLTVTTACLDIFALPETMTGYFDYVVEQTCFCAIDPIRRGEYEVAIRRILKPGGRLIGLWFPLDKVPEDGGPPWGTSLSEVYALFAAHWTIEREEFPPDSIPSRKHREKLIIFCKK
ncbi:MAG: methyltransferase domain-containing protein [Fidelibacterota bacterium]